LVPKRRWRIVASVRLLLYLYLSICQPSLSIAGLFAVTINQALFIAPCSHAFHYKCIRLLLDNNYPAFSCPLCRTFADLEEDVEVEIDPELDAVEDSDDAGGPKTAVPDGKNSSVFGHGTATVATAAAIIREKREQEAAEEAIAAGAETEVEDSSSRLTRIGGSRWHGRTPAMPGAMIVDLTEAEDEDEDMLDARASVSQCPSPAVGGNSALQDRDRSLSPMPGYGSASGSRGAEDVAFDSDGGSVEESHFGEEMHFQGKRKR
jgi:hypothetical protein